MKVKGDVILCRVVFGSKGEDHAGQCKEHVNVYERAERAGEHATDRARDVLCRSAAYRRAEDCSADCVHACFVAKGQRESANPDSS